MKDVLTVNSLVYNVLHPLSVSPVFYVTTNVIELT